LGEKEFIKETIDKLKDNKLEKMRGVSHRKAFEKRWDVGEMLDQITTYYHNLYGAMADEKKKEMREIGIYLMKKYTGLTNREIGQQWGNLNEFTVAKVYQRFLKKLNEDAWSQKVEKIETNLSNVKL